MGVTAMKQKKSTILIADSEPQIRKLLEISLEGNGYKTVYTDTGKGAIRLTAK